MIVVTGGAGFIGSNLIWGLNEVGGKDILVVDDLKNGMKHRNLSGLDVADYWDRSDLLEGRTKLGKIEAIFHMGACSSTREWDGVYMMKNNYEYSKYVLGWALEKEIPLIYASSASVYGNGEAGFSEKRDCEYPLNIYAYSKFLFDQQVRRALATKPKSPIVGLRFFNVYGPQENHKGKMASVIFHFFNQVKRDNSFSLFEGSPGFKRDFIAVADVVKMMLHFYRHQEISGIFNAGTGQAESFEAIAEVVQAVFPSAKKTYIPFPQELNEKYQKFTQADLTNLRTAGGYTEPFISLGSGVRAYLEVLNSSGGYLGLPKKP